MVTAAVVSKRVWLTDNVRERAVESCNTSARYVVDEVAAAVVAGRVACRQPRTVRHRVGRRPRAHRSWGRARFAWTAQLDLIFVVKRVRQPSGESGWLVLTLFRPLSPDAWAVGSEDQHEEAA